MANTWSARSVGTLFKYWAAGLMFICIGIVAVPASADKTQTDSAIASYLNTTVPAIERHITSIFGKLNLEPTDEDHRRVLAVLTFLRS